MPLTDDQRRRVDGLAEQAAARARRHATVLGLDDVAVQVRAEHARADAASRLTAQAERHGDFALALFDLPPERMPPDEIEVIVRDMCKHEPDDRRVTWQVANAQSVGYPCFYFVTCRPQPYAPGPPTLEVHEREESFRASVAGLTNEVAVMLTRENIIRGMSGDMTQQARDVFRTAIRR